MTIYSYSRLNTFEQCPFKFKLRYIDKIIPEVEETIESYLGRTVHSNLEWLYLMVKKGRIPSVDELITNYAKTWKENYKQEIVIVRDHLTDKDYFNKGVEFLLSYYKKHYPFDDNTLEVEKRIQINLDSFGKYKIQGYIDRLSFNKKTMEFEIHDYKTSNNMPPKEKLREDRQLGLYAIAIKNQYGEDKDVCLVWHYLAHDLKVCLRKNNGQLEQLKKETLDLIKKIESTKRFPTYVSKLCDWCEYKNICPAWTHKTFRRETQQKISPRFKTTDNLDNSEDDIIKEEEKSLDVW